MDWRDIVLLAVWAAFIAWGFWKGLFQILIPLVAVVLALVVASRAVHLVAPLFSPFTSDENIQIIWAYVLLFLGIFIVGVLIGRAVQTGTKVVPFAGTADHFAGAVVGLLVGFVLLAGLVTAVQRLPIDGMQEIGLDTDVSVFLLDSFQVVTRAVRIVPVDWDWEFGIRFG